MATTDMQLRDIRQSWESIANSELQREGLDIRIDHRSHAERGLELSPTEHMGVHASQMQRQGMAVERARLDHEAAQRNSELIREKPEQVLTLISNEKSVFDRHDIAKTLHRYINDDAQMFQNAFASVMASPVLVELQAERIDETGEVSKARYSTLEVVDLEFGMSRSAERLHRAQNHGVDQRHVGRAMERQDVAIRKVRVILQQDCPTNSGTRSSISPGRSASPQWSGSPALGSPPCSQRRVRHGRRRVVRFMVRLCRGRRRKAWRKALASRAARWRRGPAAGTMIGV